MGAVELAGPGFINVRLADGWLQEQVLAVLQAGDAYGNLGRGKGRRWQVEHVSANPTGPIHYGGAKQPEYRMTGPMGADIDAILGDELKMTKADIEDLRKAGDI